MEKTAPKTTDQLMGELNQLDDGEFVCSHKPRRVTLREWGEQLPVGKADGHQVMRDFRFKPLTVALLSEVGVMNADQKMQGKTGKAESYKLAHVLESLCGKDISSKPIDEKVAEILQLVTDDVAYLRAYFGFLESLGKIVITADFNCQRCQCSVMGVKADFGNMRVSVHDWDARVPLRALYKMLQPIKINGQLSKVLTLRMPTWGGSLYKVDALAWEQPHITAPIIIADAIIHADNRPVHCMPDDMGSMHPADLNGMSRALVELSGGTEAQLDARCKRCGTVTSVGVDLFSGSFFVRSSRGSIQKTLSENSGGLPG